MRGYSVVAPQFWIGDTGKALKKGGHEAVIVGLYLMTSPHANMLGLYYMPEIYIAHETGLGMEGASKGLRGCIEAGYCSYDRGSEVVWVHEMARFQVGDQLDPKDKRSKGVQNEYDSVPSNPYLAEFFEKYGAAFCMTSNRGASKPKVRGSKAPSKPHASQEQEQDQGQKQDQGQGQKAASAARFDAQAHLLSLGVEKQHAADWLAARKKKNLAPTLTAIEQAQSEAEKAGMAFPDAIKVAAGMGWGGFMAKWVEAEEAKGNQLRGGAPVSKAQARHDGLDAAAAEFAARMAAKDEGVPGPASQDPAAYVPPNDGNTFEME
ncbi:hypothetical protein PQR39_35275 [Paraburkholderia sediminicola]|uniref:hypothetical protein n=1 Tax=Paraburkholderia sediminicola TaxID=458836 RepID=UPI0038B9855B